MRKLTLFFAFLLTILGGGNSVYADDQTLTVHDGTDENYYVPFYSYYVDNYTKSEFVIPQEDLSSTFTSAILKGLTFYVNTNKAISYGNARFQVFLKEVDFTTFTGTNPSFSGIDETATVVYSGELSVGADGILNITFNENYEYNGGNLLIGIYNTVKGTYNSQKFLGETVTNAGLYKNSSTSLESITTGYRTSFIPKTTITYYVNNDPAVTPKDFAATTTYKSATFNWMNGGTETKWQIRYKADGDTDYTNTGDITEKPYTLTGLIANTKYYASICSKMRTADYSDWSADIEFTTPETPVLGVPSGLAARDIASTTVKLTWTAGSYGETSWKIKYKADGGEYSEPEVITENPYVLTGLTPETTYYVSICAKDDELESAWSADAEFTTTAVGPAPGGSAFVIEDFESGWTYMTNSPYTLTGMKDGWGFIGGSSTFRLHANGGRSGKGVYTTGTTGQYIVTPAVKSESTISFWAKKYDTGIASFKLVKATKDGDIYTAVTATEYAYNNSLTSNWVQYSYTIPEGGYVAIMISNVAIDDIEYAVGATTVSVTTDNYGYATYSNADKVLDLTTANLPEGLEAYKASVYGTKVDLTKLNQTVPANTGILLKGAAYTEYNIATASEGTTVDGNDFKATDGTIVVRSNDDTFIFVMKKNQPELTFGKYVGTAPLPANKAYLEVPASNFNGGNARLSFTFEEGAATGISTMENASRSNDGTIYNLQGQKVQNATKGLYIINGKKVVMK